MNNLNQKEKKAVERFETKALEKFSSRILSIILFGSKSRGDSKPYSDIDLLVLVDKEDINLWDEIQNISSEASLEYDVFLSVKVIDVEHLSYLKHLETGFIKNIEKEGRLIWSKT